MKKHYKAIRIASLVILILSVFISIDFGLTCLYSLIYEVNDGVVGPSLLMRVFGGEDGWLRVDYYNWFRNSVIMTFIVVTENIILAIMSITKGKSEL